LTSRKRLFGFTKQHITQHIANQYITQHDPPHTTIMDYEETVNYLFNIAPVFEHVGAKAYKAGLENTLALDEHFGHPHKRFKSIHIAGTNGKGSCSHTVAAMLQAAGWKVGLYTSPHLVDFRERIRVNGVCASEDYVVDFVRRKRGFFEGLNPSFFELTTAMAFDHFAKQGVDYAVVEVGLGGRLDCTNIITPILSVITNISLDHTQFIGTTLPQIAREKAGIIKSGVPVIVGETTSETRPVFEAKASEVGAPIIFAEDCNEIISHSALPHGGMRYTTKHYGELTGELGGTCQAKNTNTLLCVAETLKKLHAIDNDTYIFKAFSHVCGMTGLHGRWEHLHTKPTVVCDTGHNVGGWQYLCQQIKAQPCRALRIVFGMVDDKDINGVMSLLPRNATYYFTRANSKRAITETIVKALAEKHGLKGECYADVPTAYEQALGDASDDDFIFIGGSSYIVADILSYLK